LVALDQCGVESDVVGASFTTGEVDQYGLVSGAQSQQLRNQLVSASELGVECVPIVVTRKTREIKPWWLHIHPGSPLLVTDSRSRRSRSVRRRRGSRSVQQVALAVAATIIMGGTTGALVHTIAILPNYRDARCVGGTIGVLAHALYSCVAGLVVGDKMGGHTRAEARRVVAGTGSIN